MTAPSGESLWAVLVSQGLATGDLPRFEQRSPWYVRVMLGIGGWLGAVFLLGFVGAMFALVLANAFASVAVGALVCAGAYLIFRSSPEGDFAGQFGLAVSIAGQALIAFGLAKWFGVKLWPAALAMAAVQAALFILFANFVHRVWVVWTGVFALALVLVDIGLEPLALPLATAAFAWVWVREFDVGTKAETVRAGGYGLALGVMQLAFMPGSQLWNSLGNGHGVRLGGAVVWLGAALSAAVFLWAVVLLLKREGVALGSPTGRMALAAATFVGLMSLKAPGVGPAVVILVVGFANGNRVLAGLGIFALLGYLSQYYYALHATLLEKSAILVCTGIVLLLARLALHRWWPSKSAEVTHA